MTNKIKLYWSDYHGLFYKTDGETWWYLSHQDEFVESSYGNNSVYLFDFVLIDKDFKWNC